MPVRLNLRLLVTCGEVRPVSSTWERTLEASTRHAATPKCFWGCTLLSPFFYLPAPPNTKYHRSFLDYLVMCYFFFIAFSPRNIVTFLNNICPGCLGGWISSLLSSSHLPHRVTKMTVTGVSKLPKTEQETINILQGQVICREPGWSALFQ